MNGNLWAAAHGLNPPRETKLVCLCDLIGTKSETFLSLNGAINSQLTSRHVKLRLTLMAVP